MRINRIVLLLLVPLFAQVSVIPREITIENTVVVYEETAFMPIVFFNSGSDVVDSRFDTMIDELASRLVDNPDVTIEIRGYYHLSGDGASGGDAIAKRRAQATRNKIIAMKPGIAERILVQPAVKPAALRRGDRASLKSKIQQENQRAEISIKKFDEFSETFLHSDAKKIVKELKEGDKFYRIKRIMEDNPLTVLIIQGINIGSKREPAHIFKKLIKIKQRIAKEMDEEIVVSRIIIYPHWDESEPSQVRISLSAEPLIMKPLYRESIRGILTPSAIEIESKQGETMKVFRDDGLSIADISASWDFSSPPDPMRRYFASTLVQTASGHSERIWSKSIEFRCKGSIKSCHRRIVLANYKLDQLELSQYPSAFANRYLAAKLISELISKYPQMKISVIGYTDQTGDDERNRQMSRLWADIELQMLRLMVDGYMGAAEGKSLDQFPGVKISSIGASNSEPAKANLFRPLDENFPDVRCAKRRVEVLLEF